MITAGFTLIGRGNWSGGETYLRNMLGVIASELAGRVQAKLFLSPDQAQKLGFNLDRFLAVPPSSTPASPALAAAAMRWRDRLGQRPASRDDDG